MSTLRLPTDSSHERSLLGGIFLGPNTIPDALAEGLTPEHIQHEHMRSIYEAAIRVYESGQPVSVLAVVDDVMARGGKVWPSLVSELEAEAALAVTPIVVRQSARALVRRSHADGLRLACKRAIVDIERGMEPADVARTLEPSVSGVTKADDGGVPIDALAKSALARILSGAPSGQPTGFAEFDRLTGGLVPGEMTIVAARPAMGKTSWGLRPAIQYALWGVPTLVLSAEMTAEQLVARAIKIEAYEPNGEASEGVAKRRMEWAAAQIGASPLVVRECPGATDVDLRNLIASAVAKHGVGFVLVDYLQKFRAADNAKSTPYVDTKRVSDALKVSAMRHKIPLLALAQLNRGVEHRDNKKPGMADLRESGDIEQDAALIAFLYRPEYYLKSECPESLRGIADVIVAKNRHGKTGEVRMRWTEEATRFDDLQEGWR